MVLPNQLESTVNVSYIDCVDVPYSAYSLTIPLLPVNEIVDFKGKQNNVGGRVLNSKVIISLSPTIMLPE